MIREMERKIEGQKQNQKGGNGMKNLVVYEHDCMKSASYHLRKYKHWAKLLTAVDTTKSNGFAFIGEWLSVTSQNQVIEGSLVVEYCGYDGNREFKLYRVTQSGKVEIVASSRQTIVEFIRKAAEELKKSQKTEEKEEKEEIEAVEKKEQNQKEEKKMAEERKRLVEYVEGEIMDRGFNEDGDILVNLSDMTKLSDEEIIEVVESLGLLCETCEEDGNFRISMPEQYIIPHNNYMDMYFDKQGRMTDSEMAELLYDYINYKGFDKYGEVVLNTEFWSSVSSSQIERVAGHMGYECEFLGDAIFILRKVNNN